MAYKVNDTILHSAQGVCKITEISEKNFTGNSIEYYVLKPVYDDKSTLFIPVNNEKTATKMRPVLSVEEIHSLVKMMADESTIWIDNASVRKERYKEILTKGDRLELVRLIKTLYQHQQTQKEKGKKLHIADERFMKDAEKILYEEFAYVLNIDREQVVPFIQEHVDVEELR